MAQAQAQAQNQIPKPQVIYVKPNIALKIKDRIYYNPELAIVKDEKITIELINCDGCGYTKDYIIGTENVEIKTLNRERSSYCVMKTVEIRPRYVDEPALAARIREVFSNRQKTVVMQTYLYYRGKWYVFTYSF